MAEFQHLCMGCMKPIHESAVICPYCGYNSQSVQHAPYLPKQTVLAGRYLTGKVDALFADSVVYMGYDLQTRRTVHIHEFLPETLITRTEGSVAVGIKLGYEQLYHSCLESFNVLWAGLMRLNREASAETVLDLFGENFTSYAICEYIDSITLDEYFRKNEGPLTWAKARTAFSPILSTLAELHSMGIFHGSISPDTVTVGSDGRLRLTGFTIAQTRSMIPELYRRPKDGYAPIEIYDRTMPITQSTDVYSIAAVIYSAITGITPPVASERILNDTMVLPREVAEKLPDSAINALVSSMKIYPDERIHDIVTLQAQINADTKAPKITKVTANAGESKKVEPKSKKGEGKKEDSSSSFSLAVKTFICVISVCVIVFCMLYTTFLYKSVNIPLLDSVFAPFSFLPMNMDSGSSQSSTTDNASSQQPTAVKVKVKDFVGLDYKNVKRDAVYNNDFKLEYKFESSDTVEKDKIISQSVAKGSSVDRGTAITLIVSLGKAKVILKDVVGQTYISAYTTLYNDGFIVSRQTTPNDGMHPSGTVSAMSLVAGLEFERGTQIVLTVWE